MTKDEDRRKRENAAILKRMQNPDDKLCHTDLSAYRWAPRKKIEKDKKLMAQLYGENKEGECEPTK